MIYTWGFIYYTIFILAILTILVSYEDRKWFRSWYVYALLIIGGPGVWLILFLWWLKDRVFPYT